MSFKGGLVLVKPYVCHRTCVGKCVVLTPCPELSACLPSSPVSGSVSCPIHFTWNTETKGCIQVGDVQRLTACGTMEFW